MRFQVGMFENILFTPQSDMSHVQIKLTMYMYIYVHPGMKRACWACAFSPRSPRTHTNYTHTHQFARVGYVRSRTRSYAHVRVRARNLHTQYAYKISRLDLFDDIVERWHNVADVTVLARVGIVPV